MQQSTRLINIITGNNFLCWSCC